MQKAHIPWCLQGKELFLSEVASLCLLCGWDEGWSRKSEYVTVNSLITEKQRYNKNEQENVFSIHVNCEISR